MNLQSALEIIEKLKAMRLAQGKADGWLAYKNHIYGAAEIARRIALHIPSLDSEKAYILALLHDCGKFEQSRQQRFHGIIGYEEMLALGEPNIARSSLLHTFPFNRLPPYSECHDLYFNRWEDYETTAAYIAQNPINEYDLLVQMADNISDYRGFVTIEDRAAGVEYFHHTKIDEETLLPRRQLKEYFDQKTKIDIYSLFTQPPCTFPPPPDSWFRCNR